MKSKKLFLGVFVLAATLFISGCGSSSAATKGDQIDKLTIVQMQDENNPDAGTKNEEFRTDMQEALGVEIEELEGSDYATGIEAMKAGKLDVLLVSPMSYYQAKKVAGAEPLVTTTSMGAEEYKTVFIVGGSDTQSQALADLRGKSFAFVDPASSSGYLYPKMALIKELDLDPEKLENPDYFFKTVTYSGKHDTSVMGVAKGDYEAAAVAAQTISGLVDAGMITKDDVRVIGETEVIPNALYVVRGDLPEDIKEQLKAFYLNYENTDYFENLYGSQDVRFVEAKDEDYSFVQEMVQTLGIEEE